MNMLRQQYGIAEPVRRGMELKLCREGEWRPHCLGGSARVSEDILTGRDCDITWEDIYGHDPTQEIPFHGEMEARARMHNW